MKKGNSQDFVLELLGRINVFIGQVFMSGKVDISIFSMEKLNEWADESIVERGRRYQRNGNVEELALLPDGRIAAVVSGSRTYKVAVKFDGRGLIESDCTCPCGFTCKHAVAAVLEYRHRLESGLTVPLSTDAKFDVLNWNDKTPSAAENPHALERWLRGQTVEELAALLLDICREHPAIAADLTSRKKLAKGNTHALMREIRQQARRLIEGPDWDDDGHAPPDYSALLKKMERILPLGMAGELLDIMTSLMEAVQDQIGTYDYDGEFAEAGEPCYSTAVEILRASNLAPAQKLLWAIDQIMADEYDLSDALAQYLEEEHPPESWSVVADELLDRLHKQKVLEGKRDWGRDGLSNLAIGALEKSGRGNEVMPLCEREAKLTKSYDRLVRRLMEAGRIDDAERYIAQGVAATYKDAAGIASSLRDIRVQIYSGRRDWARVMIHHVCEFTEEPSTSTYSAAKKAANTLKCWPELRTLLLQYLQSGALPWQQKGWEWPAPDQVELARDDRRKKSFPKVEILIEIAILEKDAAEVVKWHDRLTGKKNYYHADLELEIAEAVKRHDPERALNIWRKMAEAEIALTKPAAYQTAGTYLKKAGKLMADLQREPQWRDYLIKLRAANSRKKRLMEVLDPLLK